MLFERSVNDIRHYGLAQAAALAGSWSEVEDRLAIGAPWTDEVSHGELIRSGYDETLAVGGEPWRFLIQGLKSGEHRGDYVALPWKLGVIEGVRSASSH